LRMSMAASRKIPPYTIAAASASDDDHVAQ